MILALRDIFREIARDPNSEYTVDCSYLEVYNELIYDLLVPDSPALDLREDPKKGPVVAGLTTTSVENTSEIFAILSAGNSRRKTEPTQMNSVSSRSHAVLQVLVRRYESDEKTKSKMSARLSMVDLAGSERASETKNAGKQLKDGANINRSLLALANCINALGKRDKKGVVFIPWRNSKLTRLLKDGLCGNSRTVMITTASSSSSQFQHSLNTLKYADRAKEIKTRVKQNAKVENVEEYQRKIDALKEQNAALTRKLSSHGARGNGGREAHVNGQLAHGLAHPQAHAHDRGANRPPGVAGVVGGGGARNVNWANGAGDLFLIDEDGRLAPWARALLKKARDNAEKRRAQQEALIEVEVMCLKGQQQHYALQMEINAGSAKFGSGHPTVMKNKRRLIEVERTLRDGEGLRAQVSNELLNCEQESIGLQEEAGSRDPSGILATLLRAIFASVLATAKASVLDLYRGVVLEQQHVIANLWRVLDASPSASKGDSVKTVLSQLVQLGVVTAAQTEDEADDDVWEPYCLPPEAAREATDAVTVAEGSMATYFTGEHALQRYRHLLARVHEVAVKERETNPDVADIDGDETPRSLLGAVGPSALPANGVVGVSSPLSHKKAAQVSPTSAKKAKKAKNSKKAVAAATVASAVTPAVSPARTPLVRRSPPSARRGSVVGEGDAFMAAAIDDSPARAPAPRIRSPLREKGLVGRRSPSPVRSPALSTAGAAVGAAGVVGAVGAVGIGNASHAKRPPPLSTPNHGNGNGVARAAAPYLEDPTPRSGEPGQPRKGIHNQWGLPRPPPGAEGSNIPRPGGVPGGAGRTPAPPRSAIVPGLARGRRPSVDMMSEAGSDASRARGARLQQLARRPRAESQLELELGGDGGEGRKGVAHGRPGKGGAGVGKGTPAHAALNYEVKTPAVRDSSQRLLGLRRLSKMMDVLESDVSKISEPRVGGRRAGGSGEMHAGGVVGGPHAPHTDLARTPEPVAPVVAAAAAIEPMTPTIPEEKKKKKFGFFGRRKK